MGDEELVALAEAARQIDRSREWLRQRVNRGEVRHQKIGKVVGIPQTEVDRLKRELAGKPKPRGHWPKGKPRKEPPSAPFAYPDPSEHRATGRLLRAAEH
jgi:hypothetical protein